MATRPVLLSAQCPAPGLHPKVGGLCPPLLGWRPSTAPMVCMVSQALQTLEAAAGGSNQTERAPAGLTLPTCPSLDAGAPVTWDVAAGGKG